MRRATLLTLFALLWGVTMAQFKLVPHSALDSVANPRTVPSALVVEQKIVDLGRVAESETAMRTIEIKNRGNRTVMWNCRATCRCLSAVGGVVKGGQSAELGLSFSGKGFPGPFDHKLFIYEGSGRDRLAAVVRVKGYVIADADRSGDYPYHCAGLLLRQPSVRFNDTAVERIACKNGSQRAVKVTKDAMLSSAELDVKSEPEVLQPGAEGDLIITLKGKKSENLKLYIDAPMAPRTREIKIEVESTTSE